MKTISKIPTSNEFFSFVEEMAWSVCRIDDLKYRLEQTFLKDRLLIKEEKKEYVPTLFVY